MLTLQEISELGTAYGERTIRESRAMDYAWMADKVAIAKGQTPHQLHDFIDRQLAEMLGEFNVSGSNASSSSGGPNPGTNTTP